MRFRIVPYVLPILSLALLPPVLPGQDAEKDKPVGLPNYLEVTPLIGTGGQPAESGLRLLAEKGYKAIINLRTPGERLSASSEEKVNLEAEQRAVLSLGMKYVSIPVSGRQPGDEQAAAFLKAMVEYKEDRVFIHCATGNRVGSFILIKRVLQDGVGREQAEEEARKVGLRSEVLLNFASDYISRQAAPK
jgi:protein tyrosine phosphatase (PTP) superfamily phosphohydrolase (DUF442 family)